VTGDDKGPILGAVRTTLLLLAVTVFAACADPACNSSETAQGPTPEELRDFLELPFTDQEGQSMRLCDLAGQAVLLSYVYTSCPIQTMCPLTTKKMAQIQAALPEELEGQVALVSITLDPERDPPEALKGYGEFYGADFASWSFLTAGEDAIRASASCCNVTYSFEDNGMIGHNMNLVILAPDGQIAHEYPGIDWKVPSVIATLRKLLAASPRQS
jgi:protein SCO1/2